MSFPTTRWTLLAEATLHGDAAGREALARMCEVYRRPVLAFLAARGHTGHEAEDLAQEFFLKLLEGRIWKKAEKQRGRFRSFMLAVLNNVLMHRARHENCQKRGGGVETTNMGWLEESCFDMVQAAEAEVFDRAWALTLVREAVATVAAEFERRHSASDFTVLRRFLPSSSMPPPYQEAAAALGISEVAVRTAVSRLREQFRVVLRAAVARTVAAPHEVDEELRYLAALMMQPGVSLQQPGSEGKESAT